MHRRVDNNAAAFVTTVRGKEASAAASRKKPRLASTSTNRQNVKEVWGGARAKEAGAPQFIRNYCTTAR